MLEMALYLSSAEFNFWINYAINQRISQEKFFESSGVSNQALLSDQKINNLTTIRDKILSKIETCYASPNRMHNPIPIQFTWSLNSWRW